MFLPPRQAHSLTWFHFRYFFDWNVAKIFGPNVEIHMKGENEDILPPEAWDDKHAVHVTVSGSDIYASGLVLKTFLCGKHKSCHKPESNSDKLLWQAHHLIEVMLTKDPHKRPDAAYLLAHDEFVRSAD